MKKKKKSISRAAKPKHANKRLKKTKLRKNKQDHLKNQNLLANALKDIGRQLELLKGQKLDTERQMRNTSTNISDTQSQEVALKEKVQKLTNKEEELAMKKKNLQEKIEKVKQKILKITQLEAEMEELD